MNFVQLLQVAGLSVLATLILVLFVVSVRGTVQGWLNRLLRPRYLKPVGVRRRVVRQDSER
ncbi:cellulose biosynthesis protein BcsF [Pseudomonas vlassakiae]|uniref:Cellulose biosynthesis protein BcsF n=1 Tax=Pseudomonas vlassakiae TaxID=485888 RepID=A0A923GH56_9PSED|nr:cellulose biosynthesis protein BcsF [Pseudomonas vlassakiae]MBV4544362.1 cellulose biosynthesis protein BcsF [Pseudomonas vlassakiae]